MSIMGLTLVLAVIAILHMILAAALYIYTYKYRGQRPSSSSPSAALFTMGVVVFAAAFTIFFIFTMKWNNAIRDGYSFFQNGYEVDPDSIDYRSCSITYDHDAKKVFIK